MGKGETKSRMDALLRTVFPEEMTKRDGGKCPFCSKDIDINEFRDELSRKEFAISGLCQDCQDDTFGR